VDQILSDFDKHRAETGAEGGRKKRGARGVRGGGRHKAMGSGSAGDSKKAGDSPAAAPASSSKPQNEQAPEKGNVHARIAAKRRHLPDGGCARCWAISTRCCAEAWELRQARAAAAREGVVLTGRAQEAVEVLGITQSQIRTLHRHFVEMDDGLEGRIHLNDFFEEFLEMERSAVTDAIWLALVENTTGQMLGFEDFVLIVCVYCMFTEADILRFCFSTFDINGNGDLDEVEFVQMLRIVNHKKPLFPGSFKQALRDFDTDSNGVITFDEFVEMNAKFPQLLWPLFQLQDRMQMRSLGRAAWTKISRRDAEMRQANQTSLRSKELAVKHSRGLALVSEAGGEADERASSVASPMAASLPRGASVDISGGGAAAPTPSPAKSRPAPGQRLASGELGGIALRASGEPARSASKGRRGKRRGAPVAGSRR